jgi:DNA-binding CsgD family transcriptional regulator
MSTAPALSADLDADDDVVLDPWQQLTEREREIAQHVGDGLTDKQIAGRMFLSRHTVNYHLRQIYRKLSINNRASLARRVATRVDGSGRTAHGVSEVAPVAAQSIVDLRVAPRPAPEVHRHECVAVTVAESVILRQRILHVVKCLIQVAELLEDEDEIRRGLGCTDVIVDRRSDGQSGPVRISCGVCLSGAAHR